MKIQKLSRIDQSRLEQLCELLQDAVASGASIGFLSPLTKAKATAYWQQVDCCTKQLIRQTVAKSHPGNWINSRTRAFSKAKVSSSDWALVSIWICALE